MHGGQSEESSLLSGKASARSCESACEEKKGKRFDRTREGRKKRCRFDGKKERGDCLLPHRVASHSFSVDEKFREREKRFVQREKDIACPRARPPDTRPSSRRAPAPGCDVSCWRGGPATRPEEARGTKKRGALVFLPLSRGLGRDGGGAKKKKPPPRFSLRPRA